jgi:starch phosphorylase
MPSSRAVALPGVGAGPNSLDLEVCMTVPTLEPALPVEQILGKDVPALKRSILDHLRYTLAKDQYTATTRDYYQALVHSVRDRLIDGWIRTQQQYYDVDAKRVYYLSIEFLLGRLLNDSLINLRLDATCRQALSELGLDLDDLCELEWDAGLGNGGLGRLAACFLDSMATLGLAGYGYGIRYEYGMFFQRIENGAQVEVPDNWLRYGNPWEVARPEYLFPVRFCGQVYEHVDASGRLRPEWLHTELVMAMACDIPVPGYGNNVVNTLRLWTAKSSREFDLSYFNHGDYIRALQEKDLTENISRVLYPSDEVASGQELRLKQEYFLVSATLQDILRRYRKEHKDFEALSDKVAIQLNDTHPALAIPELMRLLVDREGLAWEDAWSVAVKTFGYTNHTIMAEALERWPVHLLGRVLPRHLQIIYEINRRFLDDVARRYPGDVDRLRRVSLIEEGPEQRVRMANLAIVGSHAINGVSALHSDILRERTFHDFFELFPERFSNKTNGITPRRWLRKANPGLAGLITKAIGDRWITDLERLVELVPLAEDGEFRSAWARVKRDNKERLAQVIDTEKGVRVPTDALFDCQVKRIHEYKRQLLNVLRVIVAYHRIKDRLADRGVPRTVVFGGKAAPGYFLAKCIIQLINGVAHVVNHDPEVGDRLKVVFLPNYRVSQAEVIIPAADLSEQISTAGTEASGTSNMKFALNGALTIGTLDGANIEIREAVGDDNIFLFGLATPEVEELRRKGYRPREYYKSQPELRRALDTIRDGTFSHGDRGLFQPILESLLDGGDRYLVLADFASYLACQERVAALYQDQDAWTRQAILNVAHMGRFSSDRVIRQYGHEIWGVEGPLTARKGS